MNKLRQLIVAGGILLSILLAYLYNYELTGTDSAGCRPVRMGPSYARILGFDESHTKYASKYSLYLYREQSKDRKPTSKNGFSLDGTPVLFIPGNAGSYRQVRSIASKTTNIIYNNEYDGKNTRYGKLDFFTADFNEDFTAFHGRTMLDQADYLNDAIKFILDLYSQDEVPPKSVIIIGHSMGGIVSRVMVTLPNYVKESVKAIITLSSPHSKAPLTFDRDIMKIYQAINEFWSQGKELGESKLSKFAYEILNDTSIVSITGGLLDTVLPADYTTMRTLVNPTNGFTVFTTGVPGVWTSIDHLAIVWCDQLRTVVSNLLLDMVNIEVPEKVVSLSERMKAARHRLMTGFESPGLVNDKFVNIKLDRDNVKIVTDRGKVVTNKGTDEAIDINVFKLGEDASDISIIGEGKPTKSIFICNDDIVGDELIDLTNKATTEYLYFKCQDITDRLSMIPRNNVTKSLKESSIGDTYPPFYGMKLDNINQYKDLLILGYGATVQMNKDNKLEVFGTSFEVTNDLRTTVKFPKIKNSLLAYDLAYEPTNQLIIKQTINEETKWHITNPMIIDFHGDSPYLPPWSDGLELDIWNIDDNKEPIQFRLRVNVFISLKMLFIRYRITILSYGLMINLIVFVLSLLDYESSNHTKFPKYQKSFDKSIKFLGVFLVLNFGSRLDITKQALRVINFEQEETFTNSLLVDAILVILSFAINYLLNKLIEQALKLNGLFKQPQISNKSKYWVIGVLLITTILYLPYQVVYLVLLFVQIMKIFKLKQENEININVMILNIMIWNLPINIPILIVLVHNLTINWKTSFSSHHNILSIMPIIYMVNFKHSIRFRHVYLIIGYLCYYINYSYYYGSINTFWLYQLFNYLCIGLIIVDNDWINEKGKQGKYQLIE